MGFLFDPEERAAFRRTLLDHLQAAFPEATFAWTEDDRRLLVQFDGIGTVSLWEPNFFHSMWSYPHDELMGLATESIRLQRLALDRSGDSAYDGAAPDQHEEH